MLKKTALVAIGGNSLIPSGEEGSFEGQQEHARQTARGIAGLMADGWRVLVTHGNGPQVGAALLRSERGSSEVYPLPLHACGATTQGEIGYILQQALADALAEREIGRPVATVLTQVVVSADDPAFGRPTKPIGPFYTREQADERRRRDGWTLVEDPVHGFRRVVASPEPVEIVEAEVIRALVDRGVLVVALGGGGVPVIRKGDRLVGVDAVIDKDRASALLASRLRVERLVISTAVDHISVDFGLPSERPLAIVTADELERHYRDGQFPAGSMGPKVEAALRFLRDGGGEVIVTSPALLRDAVTKSVGTHIVLGAPTGGGHPVAATTGWTSGR